MQFTSNVLIIGGGLNGYLLAHILANANLSVTLVEDQSQKKRSKRFDGRAYALAFSSINVLKALNLWSKVEGDAQEISKMLISKYNEERSASSASLEFDKSDLDGEFMSFMLEDRILMSVLGQSLRQTSTDIIDSKAIHFQQKDSEIVVELSCGKKLKTELLVAADGKKSEIAKSFGFSRFGWDYNQKALVCGVRHERSHNGVAYQIFYPSGPFAILPLKGKRSSLVWTEDSKRADEIMNLPESEYLNCLKIKFGDFLGDIKLIGKKYSFELELGVSEQIIGKRLALVGDSAQNIHPIAGQGLNLGIRDVACLSEVLIDGFRIGEDIGSLQVLQRYEKWRSLDSTLLLTITDSVNRLFSSDNAMINMTNSTGMKLLNRIPFIKKFLMNEAMGINGDLPKLLRGFNP